MRLQIDVEERKPVWIALSELYLDTELQEYTYQYIIATFLESPYHFNQIKHIDKYEVFPILYRNLLGVAGEWAGFQGQWLINTIQNRLHKKRSWTAILNDEITYFLYHRLYRKDWKILEEMYHQIKN